MAKGKDIWKGMGVNVMGRLDQKIQRINYYVLTPKMSDVEAVFLFYMCLVSQDIQ